jgi:hypothetical protein
MPLTQRDIRAIAMAGLAAALGAGVATDLAHRSSPDADAIEAGMGLRASYEDGELQSDERAAGALWAKDHPGGPCVASSDEAFMEGCEAARKAAR